MAPLIVQLVVTGLAKLRLGWPDAARVGVAAMLLFTGASHFSPLKYDLAAMIPPPLTGALWLIYLTGVLEIAGAVGLLTRQFRRAAAWGVIALLVALFPANVYATIAGVPLNGAAPTPLLVRLPLQLFWIAVTWWSALDRRSQSRPGDGSFSDAGGIRTPMRSRDSVQAGSAGPPAT